MGIPTGPWARPLLEQINASGKTRTAKRPVETCKGDANAVRVHLLCRSATRLERLRAEHNVSQPRKDPFRGRPMDEAGL